VSVEVLWRFKSSAPRLALGVAMPDVSLVITPKTIDDFT
jgi:hypothetical protein